MDTPAPGWDHFRTFLAVLQQGSLSAAARILGLTQPTAGRHIAALEAALGTSLFSRSQQGLIPTQAAAELRPHAEAMQAAADAFIRTASGEAAAPRGTVRITASETIGAHVLPSMLADFHAQQPGIVLVAGGLRLQVAGSDEHGDEYLGLPHLGGDRVDDRHGLAAVIDEQTLARRVTLPERDRKRLGISTVVIAERAVLVAIGMLFPILLP